MGQAPTSEQRTGPATLPAGSGELVLRLLDASPDCIVMIDRDWRFSMVNRRAEAFLGVTDLVGQNLFEAYPGNREEPYASTYRRAMEEGIAGTFEAYYPAPLNVWFKVAAEPDPGGLVIYFSDISARRRRNGESRRRPTGCSR